MPCIWIKEALSAKGNKFKLEDVSFNFSISELKAKLSESDGIDEKLHGNSWKCGCFGINKVYYYTYRLTGPLIYNISICDIFLNQM